MGQLKFAGFAIIMSKLMNKKLLLFRKHINKLTIGFLAFRLYNNNYAYLASV